VIYFTLGLGFSMVVFSSMSLALIKFERKKLTLGTYTIIAAMLLLVVLQNVLF